MNNYGIISQYGFLFQKYYYMYTLLSQLNKFDFLIFEGVDDIECQIKEDSLFSISNGEVLIQLKTGEINRSVMFKVMGNWIKVQSNIQNYLLVSEQDCNINIDDDFIKDFVKEVKDSKECRETKIFKQVYNIYCKNDKFNEDKLKEDIKILSQKIKQEVIGIEEIKDKAKTLFIENYTSHIKIYDELKNKCFDNFINKIFRIIDDNISIKRFTKFSNQEVNNIIIEISNSISDTKYNIDIEEFKKKANKKVIETLKTSNLREIEQLKLVKDDEKFIVRHLTNKLLYDDFRSVYNGDLNLSIRNIEFTAFDNYEEVLDNLSDEDKNPKSIFNKTIAVPINDDLLPTNSAYSKGCYIFLTSDNAPINKQISWEVEDE